MNRLLTAAGFKFVAEAATAVRSTVADILSYEKSAGTVGPPAAAKNIVQAANATTPLFVHSGSGYISYLWIGITNNDAAGRLNSLLTVIVDNETPPSINAVPISLFGGAEYIDTQPAFASTWLTASGTLQNCGYMIRFPIPFSSSITITLTNGSSTSQSLLFWTIQVHGGIPNSWPYTRRLRCSTGRQTGIAGYATTDLVNVSAQPPGRYIGAMISIDSYPGGVNPAPAPLEGLFKIYLDGSLAYSSSGTEDWIGMSNYFQCFTAPVTTEEFGLTCKTQFTWNIYRLHINAPVYFQNALRVTWDNGESSAVPFSGTTRLAWCVWYYTQG
jgi:hypothetical protein